MTAFAIDSITRLELCVDAGVPSTVVCTFRVHSRRFSDKQNNQTIIKFINKLYRQAARTIVTAAASTIERCWWLTMRFANTSRSENRCRLKSTDKHINAKLIHNNNILFLQMKKTQLIYCCWSPLSIWSHQSIANVLWQALPHWQLHTKVSIKCPSNSCSSTADLSEIDRQFPITPTDSYLEAIEVSYGIRTKSVSWRTTRHTDLLWGPERSRHIFLLHIRVKDRPWRPSQAHDGPLQTSSCIGLLVNFLLSALLLVPCGVSLSTENHPCVRIRYSRWSCTTRYKAKCN